MKKLTFSGEMFKQLFELEYPHIYLEENTNDLLNEYGQKVDEGLDIKKALDLCQDHIMSQGMADYQE